MQGSHKILCSIQMNQMKARTGIQSREQMQFGDQMFSCTQLIWKNYYITNTLRATIYIITQNLLFVLNFEHWTEENLFHPFRIYKQNTKAGRLYQFSFKIKKRSKNIGLVHRCEWVVCIQFDDIYVLSSFWFPFMFLPLYFIRILCVSTVMWLLFLWPSIYCYSQANDVYWMLHLRSRALMKRIWWLCKCDKEILCIAKIQQKKT